MNAMKKVLCHQYAVGRGASGYGFAEFSRTGTEGQEPTYHFSLTKGLNLRYTQLPEGTERVFEVEPASTDYLHMGAMMTQSREDSGTVSMYTHVLMTEPTAPREALGLLQPGNFLTPEQFTELTKGNLKLAEEEKPCFLPESREELNPGQLERLGEFLARYWALLEAREWQGKGRQEVGLLYAGKTTEELIRFFGNEVVSRLPQYVQPAVSASFGATWDNRGTMPCVCCVTPENAVNMYPYYDMGPEGKNYTNTSVNEVEKRIGRILREGRPELYPRTYRNVEKKAASDDRFRAMARCYSTMAFCVQAELALENADRVDAISMLKNIHEKLTKLAQGRFNIEPQESERVLLPIKEAIFDQIDRKKEKKPEDRAYVAEENIHLHRSGLTPAELVKIDQSTLSVLDAIPDPQERIRQYWEIYEKRDDGSEATQRELLPVSAKLVQNLESLGQRIDRENLQRAAVIHARLGLARLQEDDSSKATEKILVSSMLKWQEDGYGAGAENETEDRYITDHFSELVSRWQRGEQNNPENAEFSRIPWSIPTLLHAMETVSRKLAEGPGREAKDRFATLEVAENKLLELHRAGDGSQESIDSTARQCIRLRNLEGEQPRKLAEEYLRILSEKYKRTDLCKAINREPSVLGSSDAVLGDVLEKLSRQLGTGEEEITGFIQAAEKLRKVNPGRADRLMKAGYPEFVRKAAQTGSFSEQGWKLVRETVLAQEQDQKTLQSAYELAQNNAASKETVSYLERLTDEAMGLGEWKDQSFRNFLLERMEEAARAKLTSGNLDEKIRTMLKENKNKLPEMQMPYCRKIAEARLDDALEGFFELEGTLEPDKLETAWYVGYSKDYSLNWSEVPEEKLRPLVRKSIRKEFLEAEDQIAFLTEMWEKIPREAEDNYRKTLSRELTRQLEEAYDELWKSAGSSANPETERARLDGMLDACMESENGGRSLEGVKQKTAWKARKFLESLGKLRDRGMSRNPEEAGRLLEEIRDAHGYEQCLRIPMEKMEDQEDELNGLVMTLASVLAAHDTEGPGYWKSVLDQIGFDREQNPWRGDGMRMINRLSFLTAKLDQMKAGKLSSDLKEFIGETYLNSLWNEKANKEHLRGEGEKVLSSHLYNWIRSI